VTPIKSNWRREWILFSSLHDENLRLRNSLLPLSRISYITSCAISFSFSFAHHVLYHSSLFFLFLLRTNINRSPRSNERSENIQCDQVSRVDFDHPRSWWTTVVFNYATMSMSDEEFDVVTARLPRVSSSVKPWWQPVAGGLNGGKCGDDSIGSPLCTGPLVSSSMRSSRCDMLRLVASSVTVRSGIYGRKNIRRPIKRTECQFELG